MQSRWARAAPCQDGVRWSRVAASSAGETVLPVATPLSGVSNAVAVSVGTNPGSDEACVVLSDGGVDCWGDDSYGSLGNGTPAGYSRTPLP